MTYQIKSGPTNFDLEAAGVKRKQSIADALLQSAMSEKASGEMIGKHYVGKGLTNAVGSIIDALLAKNMNASAKEEGASIAERKQAALQEELSSYMAQQQGTPAKDIPYSAEQISQMMQNDTPLPEQEQTPAVAPDRRAAAVKAVASQFPQLQALGQMDMQELTRQQKPVQEEWRDPVAFERDGKSGLMMTSKAGNTKVLEGYAPPKKEPLVRIDNKVGDNTFKGLADANIEQIKASKADAEKAQKSFETMIQLKPLADTIPTGTGAEYMTAMRKVGSMLGLPDDGSAAAAEQMVAALESRILENAKLLGTGSGFTDQDYERLKKILEAGQHLDGATIKHAINSGLAGSMNTMFKHERMLETAGKQSDLGFNPEVLANFKVAIPSNQGAWNASEFGYDEQSKRLTAKPFKAGTSPLEVQAAKREAAGKASGTPQVMTAAELLAKRRGGQ